MRKIGIILALVVFSLNLIGCEALAWRKYNNRGHKFSMLVPKDWDIDEDIKDGVMAVYIPKLHPTDLFMSNIRVVSDELPAPLDLSTYYDINREELRQLFKRMSEVSEGQGMSGMDRYQWVAFTSPLTDKIFIRVVSAVWMREKRFYILTCVMDLQRSQDIEPMFRKMLVSFRIH